MRPLGVVEFEPFVDDAFDMEPVLQFVQIDSLSLKGPPQPFDDDVVEVAALDWIKHGVMRHVCSF